MTERHPAHSILYDMEVDVGDVAKWGDALMAMGAGGNDVAADGVFVIGCALRRLGERIDEQWKAAFEAARGGAP